MKKGILLLDENKNYINEEDEELINKNDVSNNNNTTNLINFPEINNLHKLQTNNDGSINFGHDNMNSTNNNNNNNNINNNTTTSNTIINNIKNIKKSMHFQNNEIMIEISKYNNFIQDNISLFLLNLSNNQESINNAKCNKKY